MESTAEIEKIQKTLTISTYIYKHYEWLLNCYVLDFFTENHWNKLQRSWQDLLKNLTPLELAQLLNYEGNMGGKVWPLSILALKKLLQTLCINRKATISNIKTPEFTRDEKLLKLFWKGVKAKKRHEISIMSQLCYRTALETDCFYIVDIGSGLGHLSRMLSYGFNFKVCTIEAQHTLSQQATKIDTDFEYRLQTKLEDCPKFNTTVHLNMQLEYDLTPAEFLKIVKTAFNIDRDDFKFGIVGLHPCGDLGALLLKLYANCSNAVFINVAGCCYMKLSTSTPTQGFPLSCFSKSNHYDLSYYSREIACHAIENYVDKLIEGESFKLKIHAYRATLEKIISNLEPTLQHSALSSVKYTQDLSFKEYCQRAVRKLRFTIPEEAFNNAETCALLAQWEKVVVFYSLRLMLAPVVETIILLDRLLYIKETGSCGSLNAAFDSRISPRSQVVIGTKSNI